MGAHMNEGFLLLCCLLALAIPANSMICHTCIGNNDDCTPTDVTCPGDNDKCSTTALYIDSFPCKVRKVFKGCINSTATNKKISISPNELTTLSLQQELCDSDLCNTQEIPDPNTNLNDIHCYSCVSPGTSCNSARMGQMECQGQQKQCVDVKVVGSFGDVGDVNIKGCAQIPSCKENLIFSSQTSSLTVQCCNGNFCNSGTDSRSEDKTPNGMQCLSCNTLDGARCSPEEVVKAQCYGGLTSCLEVAGTSTKDGRPIPIVIKGCATPSMCDSSILPMIQKLGTATVRCCNGSLCNNQYTESGLKASGYLPVGIASPGTGNNTAGSGNNSSAGTSGSSSVGGYNNIPGVNESSTTYTSSRNDTGMTNEWNSSDNSSNYSIAVPVGYANIPGNNHSSSSYDSSGNGTGVTNEWIKGNDSSHNMETPLGYNNIPGSNHSSTSYSGNGTGMSNDSTEHNSSNPNTSVPVGYGNMQENNGSTTYYTSSGNGTGIANEGNYSSKPNMLVPGGYTHSPGNNGSTNYQTSSDRETVMANEGNYSSNPNMSVPGKNVNIPGNNNYSTSSVGSGNGTVFTTEWIDSNSSNHNMALPGGGYGSFNSNGSNYFSNSNYSSNPTMDNNVSTNGNVTNFGNSWGSIGSYLNPMPSGANNNGSYSSTPYRPNELIPGGSNHSNESAWVYSSNYNPSMMPNNNGSFSTYNDIQKFLSKLNDSIIGNGTKNINEWIQNNSFFSNLMPPGMNHNGSSSSGYNINSIYNGSLINYFNSLGKLQNISSNHNITSIFSGGNSGSFNFSDFISGWNNVIHNSNLMNPYKHPNGSTYSSELIPPNSGSSYNNIPNPPNLLSPASPNSTGSTNSNGYFGGAGFNDQPFFNNGNTMGHENINSSSYNPSMMGPGVGSGGSSYGGAGTDGNSNGYNTNPMGHSPNGSVSGNGSNTDVLSNNYNPDLLIPGRSTNDSTVGAAGNSTGGGNGANSASSPCTSCTFVFFSTIALLVLN